ncbi:MAG: flagellar biosynthetic protein FliR [Phycisphaerae bacterium]
MPYELLAAYLKLPLFGMVVARLAGMLMFVPLLGGLSVPFNVRILLIVGLSMLITPMVPAPAAAPDTLGETVLALAGELFLGVLMGLSLRLCFLGLELGGLLIAQESGLAFGQIADPSTGEQHSELSMFYIQLFGVTYLIVGGHRALVDAALGSFRTLPLLGDSHVFEFGGGAVLDALTVGAGIGIRIAAPVVIALFLVNVALGLMTKAVPALNIVTVGFSLKTLIAFGLMAVSLPTAVTAFTDGLETVAQMVQRMVLGT